MISVNGYSNLQIIYQSTVTLVYSARRTRDGKQVILKQLRPEIASPDQVAHYRKEFEILQSLDSGQIIKAYDLIEQNNTPILVMEDAGHQSLHQVLRKGQLSLLESLEVTHKIAEALDCLHANHIIHKNINPTNILYDKDSNDVKLIDFRIASQQKAFITTDTNDIFEGSLTYISPEQTGRLNRSLDYRSDLYSLGAVLYQLLTGNPPFRAEDSLQLVFHHIARQPVPPADIDPKIPAALSRVTLKLL